MALTDFLTEGAAIPEGSALKATTSQTVLPDWYTKYATQLLANQQALGTQAYTPYQGPRVAGFTQPQQQGFQMAGQAAGAYKPAFDAAMGAATGTEIQRAATTLGSIADGGGPTGIAMAQPYLGQASGSAASVADYMNPYTDSVVNRIADLGTRNLTDNLLPQIEGRYIGAGQWNGTGKTTDTARAIRDVQADVLAQQNTALNQGYTQAQAAKQADLARYAGLGATAGTLGTAQQRAMTDAGVSLGNLSNTAAMTLGDLAGKSQQYGLTGAAALGEIGKQQQGLNQQNLDVAYSDFLRQQGYPQSQIDAMLGTFKGVATGIPTATQEVGIVPNNDQTYKPSTASTIASALAGAGGLLSAITGL